MSTAPRNPGEHDKAPDAVPKASQRKRQARPGGPELPGGRSLANPYVPKFMVEIWIHPDMRARNPNRPLTLCEAAELGRKPEPAQEPEPDPELEAEP